MRSELNHAGNTMLCLWGPVPPERRKYRKAVVSFPAAPGSFAKSLLTSRFFKKKFFFFFFHILSHWFITGSSTQSRMLDSRTLLLSALNVTFLHLLTPNSVRPSPTHPASCFFVPFLTFHLHQQVSDTPASSWQRGPKKV